MGQTKGRVTVHRVLKLRYLMQVNISIDEFIGMSIKFI